MFQHGDEKDGIEAHRNQFRKGLLDRLFIKGELPEGAKFRRNPEVYTYAML
jgi:hypothetical protein